MTLIAFGNTYNPCLQILRTKGYQLVLEQGGKTVEYLANKGDDTFVAHSPPELLGLICLWESRKEQWCQQEPDIMGELAEEPQ